jgi:hypothetical protein
MYSLEQKDVRLRLVHLVVLPAQTLCDAQTSPLVFPKQLEGAARAVEVVLGDGFEHLLGQLHMAVLVVVVVVPAEKRCGQCESKPMAAGR